jgi:hypothetical protein
MQGDGDAADDYLEAEVVQSGFVAAFGIGLRKEELSTRPRGK